MDTDVFSLARHLGPVATGFEWLVSLVEILAILILVLGLLRFVASFFGREALRRDAALRHHAVNVGRIELARHIQAALEVFIVSDIIRTVLHLTLDNLLILALLVAIRTVIGLVLEYELRHLERDEAQRR